MFKRGHESRLMEGKLEMSKVNLKSDRSDLCLWCMEV